MTYAMEHCHRPWWKRPPLWFIVIAAVLTLLIVIVTEKAGKPVSTPYSIFLDQLKAGNVARALMDLVRPISELSVGVKPLRLVNTSSSSSANT